MKRNIFSLSLVIGLAIILLTLVFNGQVGKANNVQVSIGESTKFTQEEINEAVAVVKKKFKEFEGCELTELWYSEDKSNELVKEYLKSGNGSSNGAKEENVIILLSNFDVNSSGGDGSFEPNSTQEDWNWILIRDSKTDEWRVDDWGY